MHDINSRIFEIIRDLCKYNDGLSVDMETLKRRVIGKGWS